MSLISNAKLVPSFGHVWRQATAVAAAITLSACVISTDTPVFESDDYAVIDGLTGLWRQAETSEGDVDPVLFRIGHMGAGRYRALGDLQDEELLPGEAAPEASDSNDDEPVDFAFVPLAGETYILVSPESSADGEMSVIYLGARFSEDGLTTYLFGGGDDTEEKALRKALASAGLQTNPEFDIEWRLKGTVTKAALKAVFTQIMQDPEIYGAYWTRYERVGD